MNREPRSGGNKTKGEYVVRLGGPDEELEFALEESFFATRQNNDWNGGEIRAVVNTIKETGVITMEFNLRGYLHVMCDRCLEYYPQVIDSTQKLFVKFGEEDMEMDENIIVISREEHLLDISPFLEEFLILALPLKKVHANNEDGSSGCDKKMIEKLEKHLVKDIDAVADPRWDELKKLKDKN